MSGTVVSVVGGTQEASDASNATKSASEVVINLSFHDVRVYITMYMARPLPPPQLSFERKKDVSYLALVHTCVRTYNTTVILPHREERWD